MTAPRQGEVWWAEADTIVGGEIAKRRPVLILSGNVLNRQSRGLSIAAALMTTPQEFGVRVELPAAPGEARRVSYILPWQIRTISHQRLVERIATTTPAVSREVKQRLALLLRED